MDVLGTEWATHIKWLSRKSYALYPRGGGVPIKGASINADDQRLPPDWLVIGNQPKRSGYSRTPNQPRTTYEVDNIILTGVCGRGCLVPSEEPINRATSHRSAVDYVTPNRPAASCVRPFGQRIKVRTPKSTRTLVWATRLYQAHRGTKDLNRWSMKGR